MSSANPPPPAPSQSTASTPQDLINQRLLALRKQKEEASRHKQKKGLSDGKKRQSFFQPPPKSGTVSISHEQVKPWGQPKSVNADSAIQQLKLLKSVKSKEPVVEALPPPTAPPEELDRLARLEKAAKQEKTVKFDKAAKIEQLAKLEREQAAAEAKKKAAATPPPPPPVPAEPPKPVSQLVQESFLVPSPGRVSRPKSLPILSTQRRISGKIPLPQFDFVSTKNRKSSVSDKTQQNPAEASDAPAAEQPKISLQQKTGAMSIVKPPIVPAVQVNARKASVPSKDSKIQQAPTVPSSKAATAPQDLKTMQTAATAKVIVNPSIDPKTKPPVSVPTTGGSKPLQDTTTKQASGGAPQELKTNKASAALPSSRSPVGGASADPQDVKHKPKKSSIPFASPQDEDVEPSPDSTLPTATRKSFDGGLIKKQPTSNQLMSRGDSVTVLQFTDSWEQIDEEDESWGEDRRGIAIERAPTTLHPRNLTDSDLDILRPGKDEAEYVTIIPADESKIVDQELSKWKRHRFTFIALCWLILFMGIAITSMSLYSSLDIYKLKTADGGTTTYFTVHTDVMIFISTSLSALGILIFRMFPDAPKHILMRLHVIIFIIIYAAFIYAFVVAFNMHQEVTTQEAHVYSIHGTVGVMITGFMLYEAGSGVYLIFKPNSPSKRYHWAVGMITFMTSGATCASGFLGRALGFEKLLNPTLSQLVLTNTTAVLILIFCCVVRYMETEFRFRRRSCPEWDAVFARSTTNFEEENVNNPNLTLQQYVRNALRARHYHEHYHEQDHDHSN